MIKIRLHGEKQEIEKVSKAIKEQFNVLNVSGLYKDRGESVYYRGYIDAEIKEQSPEIIDEFKKLLEKSKSLIVSKSIDQTYSACFMLATGFFRDTPINLEQIEKIICDFAVMNTAKKLDEEFLNAILKAKK